MNINKDIAEKITLMLKNEFRKINDKLQYNKKEMAELVYKQTVLKREKAEIGKLLNLWVNKESTK